MDCSKMNHEQIIEHEVRFRVHDERFQRIEKICEQLDSRFNQLEDKIDSKFNFMIGIVMASVLLPITLHLLKLTS
jgi:hypothetical protein